MFELIVALAFSSCVLGILAYNHAAGSHSPGGRIVGGHDANIADYPYQLALIYEDFGTFCGATLIAPNWAVTAAHCTDDVENTALLSVRAGSSLRDADDGQVVQVSRVIQHDHFDYSTADNDIALLELVSNITLAKPVVIASSTPATGEIATISGWGILSEVDLGNGSYVLQVAEVPIIDQEECKAVFSAEDEMVTDTMFCAGYLGEGGIDTCTGDSGCPLVVDGVLSGIVSWGTGCAEPEYPGVYTDVSYFRDWIEEKTGNSPD